MNKNKNLGFTLAEVLIVIGIIGVVAALTLPNLNHATGNKETVTRVKKIYSALTEALDRAQAIYGPFDTWFSGITSGNSINRFGKRVTEFMKISKECNSIYITGCFTAGDSRTFDGVETNAYNANSSYFTVLTADNMSIAFFIRDLPYITVDIDGPKKGPYTLGKDLFQFKITENQVAPVNQANWILNYDNVDYLKADSSGKCNDSNIILDGVNNTSCH